MSRYYAIVATTHRLENGFQHSRADLESLAEGLREKLLRDPFINENHLEGTQPLGRVTSVAVSQFTKEGEPVQDEYALYVEYEPLSSADPARVKRLLEAGGFSIAFFSARVGRSASADPLGTLSVGVTGGVIGDLSSVKPLVDELVAQLPDTAIEVGRYHEHALLTTATLILVLSWAREKFADKLFDAAWSALSNVTIAGWRKLVARVKLSFDSPKATVHVTMPSNGSDEQYKKTLRAITEDVIQLNEGTIRRRVAITVTEEWTIERHVSDL